MTRSLALAVLLATTALPAHAQEAAPVREVTLFEAGLAELTRETGSAGEVALRVPLADVDDVLKTLLVRGTGIGSARMTLAGPDPVADAFAALPFPPGAATDLATLLRTVPGLRVALSYPGAPTASEGVVLSVGEICTDADGCRTTVTVIHDDGAIRQHILGGGVDLTILDADIADALRRGLEALRMASSGNVRQITVAMEGDAIEDGALSYVIAAPAWKTAYRALTGEAGVDLQAWAVIENATGEDWDDVRLTLSSGSPRTLQADLFGRAWRERDGFASEIVEMPVVAIDQSFAPQRTFEMTAGAVADIAPAPAPITAQTGVSEGTIDSRFTFDGAVDLDAGEMLSMPFLAEALEARSLVIWQGALSNRTGNPRRNLEITNTLPVRLPAGIMTVSDADGGYVGDASVPVVAPGETREVYYGDDRGIRVEETSSSARQRLSVQVAQGALRVRSEDRRTTTYAITAHSGAAADLVIDHPLQPGWTARVSAPEGLTGTERQDDDGHRWLRIDATVDEAAEEAGTLSVTVADTYPLVETVSFGTLNAEAFLYWSGEAATDDERAFLATAATLAGAIDAAGVTLTAAEGDLRRLIAEQTRVSALVQALDSGNPTYDRFLEQLVETEDAIATATGAADAARADLAARQAALAAHLAGA